MDLLTKLKSLRPRRVGFAFTDIVSGRPVYYFTNGRGAYWMANSAWSLFRCYIDHEPTFTYDAKGGA